MQYSNTAIERAETTHDVKLRARKVQIFRWQARTAALCILARALLLFSYARVMFRAQSAVSLPVMGLENFAALTFLLIEIAFTRESGAHAVKDHLMIP